MRFIRIGEKDYFFRIFVVVVKPGSILFTHLRTLKISPPNRFENTGFVMTESGVFVILRKL